MPISGNDLPRRRGGGPPQGPSFQESLRESEQREVDFPAKERASYIRAMVQRVAEFKREGLNVAEIKERLPEFARDYQHLFEMVTQGEGYDASNLQTMLHMLDKMGQGNLNPHQASVIVGQRLASKYFHSVPGGGAAPAPPSDSTRR
jgi:hypothetical protein